MGALLVANCSSRLFVMPRSIGQLRHARLRRLGRSLRAQPLYGGDAWRSLRNRWFISYFPGMDGRLRSLRHGRDGRLLAAAAAKAPTTSILILFEMTNDYRIMLPLMAATVGSVYVSHRMSPTACTH